jgi:1-acyl-sn-glycerol-3-phosphate acyltransferase
MLFFLHMYFIVIREFIKSGFYLKYENQINWGRDVFKFNKWLYGWRQQIHIKQDIPKNNILMIGNHVNLTDIFQLQEMINTLFPFHKMTYLVKKDITNIPFFGEFIKNNHIVVGDNHEENIIAIQKYMKRLQNERIILFIFPEGGTYYKDNIRKSNEWCKKQNISPYQSCMCPKTRGLYTILNAFSFDAIIQTYLTYPDDIHREKGVYYTDFFTNKLPRISEIYVKDISTIFTNIHLLSYEEFSEHIYSYWREVDETLTTIYKKYENLHIEFMKNKHIFYDVVIGYNYITWNSTKYLLFFIPIGYFTHGLFFSVSLTGLFFTSYQYHIHNKMKYADIFMSVFMITLSFLYNTCIYSNVFLSIGIGFYIIEKCIEYYITNSNSLLYCLHSMLHVFAYSHLFVEFLHKSL